MATRNYWEKSSQQKNSRYHYDFIDSVVCCSYPISKKWGTSFEKLEEKYIREDLYNQLGATMIFCQRIIKNFLKTNGGNIILLSSIQGVQAPKFDHYKKTQMTSPIEYSAIKSGIISMTKYLAKYYKNSHQHPILASAKDITYDITFECFEIRKNLKAL